MFRKAVFTGGPNAGKTTVLRALRKLGFPVIEEKATEVLREGRLTPATQPVEFRLETLTRQMAAERTLTDEPRTVLCDRGAYDGRGYCLATDCPEPRFLQEVDTGMYGLAFVFAPVPTWEDDGVRYEDVDFCYKINPVLAEVYRKTGARVVEVPLLPVEERVNLVLATLREHGCTRS